MKQVVKTNERGAIAIYLVSIIAILLVVTTSYAAKLTINELNQSSQVDRSEDAFYAAEAGIEDALKTLDGVANPTSQLQTLFPNQYDNGTLVGDYAVLPDTTSSNWPNYTITKEPPATDPPGLVSWRQRKVYPSTNANFAGSVLKDQSLQFDTSYLTRKCSATVAATGTIGQNPPDCNSAYKLFQDYSAFRFCWARTSSSGVNGVDKILAVDPSAAFELTAVSFNGSTSQDVKVEKTQFTSTTPSPSTLPQTGNTVVLDTTTVANYSCVLYQIASSGTPNNRSRGYIFRVRLVSTADQDVNGKAYSVDYQVKLLSDGIYANGPDLQIPGSQLVIDVVGQSGDIRRRVVATKTLTGQLIGIFDYALFSGSSTSPVCKVGPQSTDQNGAGIYNSCALNNSVVNQ